MYRVKVMYYPENPTDSLFRFDSTYQLGDIGEIDDEIVRTGAVSDEPVPTVEDLFDREMIKATFENGVVEDIPVRDLIVLRSIRDVVPNLDYHAYIAEKEK
jgi:hypothetical protein